MNRLQALLSVRQRVAALTLLLALSLLSGCGGAEVESNPPPVVKQPDEVYKGPAAQTADIQQYKTAFWDNVSPTNRCGSCHVQGKTAPAFARNDDVNLAYAATTPLVNLADPASSKIVLKVAGGHNCWLSSAQACADTMTQWIKLWANTTASTQSAVSLVVPTARDVGSSKALPASSSLYQAHVYPIVSQFCVGCHTPSSVQAQAPFFAHSNVDTAYDAAKPLINLDKVELSRLVQRLGKEFHNCWGDCAQNAATMQAAIQKIADAIPATQLDASLVPSKALRLADGVVASSGGRFERNQIAFYQFKTGEGAIAYDTSGIEPAANLTLQGDIRWITGWGIHITSGRGQATTDASKKFAALIGATGEFSIEAWVVPANVSQEGPAAIVSYAGSSISRNFTLGQTLYNYNFLLRNERTGTAGTPTLSTPDAKELLQATLQHVVLTYDLTNGRRIFVNGVDSGAREAVSPLKDWDDTFALMVGNEANGNRQWQGSVRLLAIHNKALTPTQIKQNFDVGVGQKFYLLFGIGHLINLPETYVLFTVSQFDDFSYLFSQPQLVNLNGNSLPSDLSIEGMALGLNGKEVDVGQAWLKKSWQLPANTALKTPTTLSNLGTIIASEGGAGSDEFFLSFAKLGNKSHVRVSPSYNEQGFDIQASQSASQGLRTFAKIHASMSELTGVAMSQSKVASVYQTILRQLPSDPQLDTFVSSQQMAVTQLGIAYCDAAIEDSALRSTWFPGIDFNQPASSFVSEPNQSSFLNLLLNRLQPLSPTHSAPRPQVTAELTALMTRLAACGTSCDAARSKTIAKAACTAVLASSETLVY